MWCAVSGPLRCVVRFSTNFSYKLIILPLLNEKAELLSIVLKKTWAATARASAISWAAATKLVFEVVSPLDYANNNEH
jgi:hypothetical protein